LLLWADCWGDRVRVAAQKIRPKKAFSASVLHVLRDTIAKQPPSGNPGVLMAMGPGFCSELVLLRWH
jgi:hypothetical protein